MLLYIAEFQVKLGLILFMVPGFNFDKTEANLTRWITSQTRKIKDYRPVLRNSDKLRIDFSLSISQLVNLDTRNQVVVSSVWPTHEWTNSWIKWDPKDYDGITHLYLLSGTLEKYFFVFLWVVAIGQALWNFLPIHDLSGP